MSQELPSRDEIARITAERDEALRGLTLARETAQGLTILVVQTREAAFREAENILQDLMEHYRSESTKGGSQDSSYQRALEALEAGLYTITELRVRPED